MADLIEIRAILQSGDFDRLMGKNEDDVLEFKTSPYRLETKRQKMELAKDVSAFANAGGGIIVIGIETQQQVSRQFDQAVRCRPFERAHLQSTDMENVLRVWIYPPIRGLEIKWHASHTDPTRGVASISVPQTTEQEKPYLVATVLDESDREIGFLVGYFERAGSTVTHLSASEIRERFKDGVRFSEIIPRLTTLEETVARIAGLVAPSANQVSPSAPTPPSPPLDEGEVRHRINAARHTGGFDGPTFWLAAYPLQRAEFQDLFRSAEAPPVQLLQNPPFSRYAGFDLTTQRSPEIVEGQSRRCLIPHHKLLQLWQDGLLSFVANGGDSFLCWAMQSDERTGLRINNIALAEVTYVFCELALALFPLASPRPDIIKFLLGFSQMRMGEHLVSLSPYRPSQFNLSEGWREASRDAQTFEIQASTEKENAGAIAFKMLSRIYTWFSFEEAQIPYVRRDTPQPELDYKDIVTRRN